MSQHLETIAEKTAEWVITAIIGGLAGAVVAIRPSLASNMKLILPLTVLAFVIACVAVGVFDLFVQTSNDELKKSVEELSEKVEKLDSGNN